MTPKEIEHVRAAKQADTEWWPEGLAWAKTDTPGEPLWCWDCSDFAIDPADDEDGSEEWKREAIPFEERIEEATLPLEPGKAAVVIRDALHRRLLERGAWVEQRGDLDCHYVYISSEATSTGIGLVAHDLSLISAMALAIVALAQGGSHAQA